MCGWNDLVSISSRVLFAKETGADDVGIVS
jgi:hypothetical protein